MKDDLSALVVRQLETSEQFRQPRLAQIRENEDMIAGKVKPALQGRYSVPFDGVIASGFIETIVAQINKPPKLVFSDPKGSNHKSVKKIQALWERDSSPQRQNWAKQDRLGKRIAAASNICIFEYIARSNPYKGVLRVIDPYDFHCEPNGGNDLEEHMFKGVYNQFITQAQMKYNAESGYYDQDAVSELLAAYQKTDYKFNEELHRNKVSRLQTLGLDLDQNAYVGQQVFNTARWVTEYKGKTMYIEFDYRSGIILKKHELQDVFESKVSPWVVWNPVENAFSLWAPGLFDHIKPIAEAIRINLNEILNNNRKRNWDMKAVDRNMFPNVSDLNWRQDGVVSANVPMGQSIQNGIYYFQTPEISGALNLNQYLNDFLGINTGISDQTKGEASQDVLGIAKINDVQVSKRMRLIGDSYADAYAKLGFRWDWGLYEHLDTKEAVKIVGVHGVEFESVTKEDTDPDYDIGVVTYEDELIENEQERERKASAMERISANPLFIQQLNPRWVVEQELRIGGWRDEEVRRAMDTKNDAYDETISVANKNIERALEGKEPKRYRGATTGYLQRIHDYLNENLEGNNQKELQARAMLEAHFIEHVPITDENEARLKEEQYAATGQAGSVEGEVPTTGGPATVGGMGAQGETTSIAGVSTGNTGYPGIAGPVA